MRRITTTSLFVMICAPMALLFSSGCASTSIKRLSGDEFLRKAKLTREISSFSWTSYIGSSAYESSGWAAGSAPRVYLEYQRPSLLWNIIGRRIITRVYWTYLSELPDDIADQVRARKEPWKPYWAGAGKKRRTEKPTVPK